MLAPRYARAILEIFGIMADGGRNIEYIMKKIVKDACAGGDGPDTYSWDYGITP